ncbi:MAG: TSUP family transporter, partial [Agathobacter sp.]
MTLTPTTFLIVCPLVFLAGLVDAAAGGGGLISLPAYVFAGLPIHTVIGTNKLSSCMGTALATYRYGKQGFIRWKRALPCAVAAVVGGLLAVGQPLPFAIVLGSIAAATAPAATIMVIRQYNAKGPVTKTLLSVVALDDAVALIAFGFAVAISKALTSAEGSGVLASVAEPFIELGLSILFGTL